jgi:uncharacterized cupredoxin-like copper-binding protein
VAPNRSQRRTVLTVVTVALAAIAFGCDAGSGKATPPIVAGSSVAPREVNLIARDYAFVPAALELVPGETILLHVINGGLVIHEAVIGDASVQDAWETAEAATVGAPPGPTPIVTVPSQVAGIRVVVESGERIDLTWTVPPDAADSAGTTASRSAWLVGCHIPGHWAKGMQVPVVWVVRSASASLAMLGAVASRRT